MTLATIFLSTVPIAALAAQIALGLFLLIWLGSSIFKKKCTLTTVVAKHRNVLSMIVAIIAVTGSLFYSKIVGYTPCELCWYQRICMYPLAPLLVVATWKKKDALLFVLPLLIVGAGFSIYHYNVQFFNVPTFCSSTEISCALKGNVAFGYITIPLMALTAFMTILALQLVGRKTASKARPRHIKRR